MYHCKNQQGGEYFKCVYIPGTFEQYDYGEEVNMVKYKQPQPPHYDLQAVTSSVALLYATNDALTDWKVSHLK